MNPEKDLDTKAPICEEDFDIEVPTAEEELADLLDKIEVDSIIEYSTLHSIFKL
jgi:hypothetical protein